MQDAIRVLFCGGLAAVSFPAWSRVALLVARLTGPAIAEREVVLHHGWRWERRMNASWYWITDHPFHVMAAGLIVWAVDLVLVIFSL